MTEQLLLLYWIPNSDLAFSLKSFKRIFLQTKRINRTTSVTQCVIHKKDLKKRELKYHKRLLAPTRRELPSGLVFWRDRGCLHVPYLIFESHVLINVASTIYCFVNKFVRDLKMNFIVTFCQECDKDFRNI